MTAQHWTQLDKIHDCLKTFEVASSTTQGHRSYFSEWFQTLSWLLHELDNWRLQFEEDSVGDKTFALLSKCCEASWQKAEKYYRLADDTPIVYAAIMLDPREKKQWFIDEWSHGTPEQQAWIIQVERQVKALWQAQYKPSVANASQRRTAVSQEISDDPRQRRIDYMHKRRRLNDPSEPIDQLDAYLATDTVPRSEEFDVIAFWLERQQTLPQLAKFALDCLAIPCMSDDAERSFSSGRDLITYRRNRLSADIIEATQCLRNWYGRPLKTDPGKAEVYSAFDDEDTIEQEFHGSRRSPDQTYDATCAQEVA